MTTQKTQNTRAKSIVIAAAAAVLVIVVGLFVLFAGGGQSGDGSPATSVHNQDAGSALPSYVLAAGDRTAMAYQFALERPDVMLWMNCYCGCGGHSGHKNARDCFIKPASTSGHVQFDEHGSGCNVCVDIALRARELTLAGRHLSEIRATVDQEFGDIGPGTDTPPPPG